MQRDTKVFLTNAFHLTFLRGISRVIPLIYTPFLISKLGLANVGTIEFVKALSFYFTSFISYGFRYSATKQIILYKDQKTLVGQVISSVYALKFIAIAMSFLIMLGLIKAVPSIRQDKIYLLSFFPVVMASTLFPTFVFQALEKIKWLTALNLITKLLFIMSIFAFIRQPTDTILVPILLGSIDLLRLIIAGYLVYNNLEVAFCWPKRSIMISQIKEGIHIFFPELATMFYARMPAIFLRLFVGPAAVGIYSMGDKIIRTTTGMIDPFMQALYPIAYQKIATNKRLGMYFVGRVGVISLSILGALGVWYWFFAEAIVKVLAGKALPEGVGILKLHAFLPVIIILSNIVGIGILLPLGAGKKYTFSMLLAGLVCGWLHFILVPTWQVQGAAWAVLIAEAFATLMMIFWAYQEIRASNLSL